MSRRSGKTFEVISRAVETGAVIITHSKTTRDYILYIAELMHVEAPKVIVVENLPNRKIRRPVTIAGVFVDYP